MTYYYIFCACGENVGKNWINKKAKRLIIDHLAFYFVPRPGVEPGRVSPLVFETSASTDSAIWALCGCKGRGFLPTDQILTPFFVIPPMFLLPVGCASEGCGAVCMGVCSFLLPDEAHVGRKP